MMEEFRIELTKALMKNGWNFRESSWIAERAMIIVEGDKVEVITDEHWLFFEYDKETRLLSLQS